MPKKSVYILMMLILGASLGVTLLPDVWIEIEQPVQNILVDGLIGAIVFVTIAIITYKHVLCAIKRIEAFIAKQSLYDLLFGILSVIIGLILGALLSIPFYSWTLIIPTVIMLITGYLGFRVGIMKLEDFTKLFTQRGKKNVEDILERKIDDQFHKYKILDTSVIIDGRIYDISQTGFIEGTLLIPKFVLYELQSIADSSDSIRRVRGRRGLDILNALQKEADIPVEIYEGDFDDIQEVDSKLVKLAKVLDGIVVTNDYNLNKVCEVQNVPVFNINALANAIKPVVIPGETMEVMVIKVGTERQQGVAYLEDGTMVVVEEGKFFINETIKVIVTSALQTAAGRMIFAKPYHSQTTIQDR